MRNANQLFNSPTEEITSSYGQQILLDIVFILIFIVLIVLVSKRLYFFSHIISHFNWLSGIVLAFAIFRLTKLFLSDHIMQWLRDLFLVVKTEKVNEGIKITRTFPQRGLRREVALLLDCPWCLSLWLSLLTIYLWILHPMTHFFFYVMALSGASVLLWLGAKCLKERKLSL